MPVIDKFVSGQATSIKSLDLNAKSYQTITVLSRTIRGYIDKVAAYKGTNGRQWAGVEIKESQISGRGLDLAIPNSGNALQQKAIQDAVRYGASQGVVVNPILFP